MLVFAVLLDESGITKETSDIVVVSNPEHHIPLFTVRFRSRPDPDDDRNKQYTTMEQRRRDAAS